MDYFYYEHINNIIKQASSFQHNVEHDKYDAVFIFLYWFFFTLFRQKRKPEQLLLVACHANRMLSYLVPGVEDEGKLM